MGFEMLLVNSAATQGVENPRSQVKSPNAGTGGAFQALLSMALSAFFGGGPANVARSEPLAQAQGSQSIAETVAGTIAGPVEASVRPQAALPTWEALIAGQGKAETGGNVRAQAEGSQQVSPGYVPDVPIQAAGTQSQAVPAGTPQATGEAVPIGVTRGLPEASRPALGSFHEALAEAGVDPGTNGMVVAARTVTEPAVAPALSQAPEQPMPAGVVRPAQPDMGNVADRTTSPSPAAAPAAEQPVVAAPRSVPGPEQPAQSRAGTVAKAAAEPKAPVEPKGAVEAESPAFTLSSPKGAPVQDDAGRRQDAAKRDSSGEERFEADSVPAPRSREAKGSAEVAVDSMETHRMDTPAGAIEKPPATVPADRAQGVSETQSRLSLRDARAVSETLLQESLKKLPRSVELQLDPPELGNVTVLLSQRGQDVTVKFLTGSGDAQRMLQSVSNDLGKALSEKGLVLTGFSVDPGFQGQNGHESRGDAGKPASRRYRRAAEMGAISAAVRERQPAGSFSWLA